MPEKMSSMGTKRPSPVVYGIETEYSCLLTFPGHVEYELAGSCHNTDGFLGQYVDPENSGGSKIPSLALRLATEDQGMQMNENGMLSNGARFYIDPSGFEYDTPETTTAEEAVHRMFDGDKFLLNALLKLSRDETIERFQLNRHIIDHNGSSRGIHLNTVISSDHQTPSPKAVMLLATLNVAKGALFGSGGLLIDHDREVTEYHHSPRLSITTDIKRDYIDFSRRPLVRLPFKPDYAGLRRVESVTSDALNFGWPLRASLVLTNAVTGLIEMGYTDSLPLLYEESAVQSAQNVGKNGPEGIVKLEKGSKPQTASAVGVLRYIAEYALAVDGVEDYLDAESKQVIPEIIEVADLAEQDMYLVGRDVESVARLAAMERQMEETKTTLDSEKICRFDYKWDKIGGGTAEMMRAKGSVGWRGFSRSVVKPSEAKRRLVTPPQDTRARIRGAVIDVEQGQDESTWNIIKTHEVEAELHPLDHDLQAFLNTHDL